MTPAHVVAFVVLQMPAVDMAAWMLMSLSFALCAVAALRTSDDEWDLPPRESIPRPSATQTTV